jgi:anti-sigma regulatory factor (Ser/Thr protein kinase)
MKISSSIAETFTPDPDQVGAARRLATSGARAWGVAADDMVSVVSELAANAVQHGRSRFTVSLGYDGSCITIEVADDNPRLPALVPATAVALSGRGLGVVDSLASNWGARPSGDGKVVWAEVEGTPAVTPG